MTLVFLSWGFGLCLLALALVATLLPRSRSGHWIVVVLVWALAAVGVGGAAVTTWSWAVVTEDDLYDAALVVQDVEHRTPGHLSQQRLMALVSAEVGHDVFAEPAGATSTEEAYELRPAGADDPSVCVQVQFSAGTETDLPTSILVVNRGRCA